MSITKGSMLISNANAVGAELVNKLGGTGYKPVEWADAINLLGIRDDDKASALAGITEGTYTGDERGSIKYSNCNAVGSMLNKKFSTDRGFKPVEWESAISKLTPLAEGTVSGSVVSIENGAEDVPTKSLVVTIPPTLSGVSSVTETQIGRNLFDVSTATNGQINGTNGVYYANANWQASDFFSVHGENLTLSWDTDSSNYYQVNLAFYDSAKHYIDGSNNRFANTYSKTFTIPSGAVYCRASWSISVGGSPAPRNNIRINLGSTDGGYTPYTSPTTYTASLGRTIYGGTADIVNGEGHETWEKKVYTGANNEYWVSSKSGDVYRYYVINDNVKQPTGRGVVYSSIGQYSASSNEVGTCFTYYSSGINRVLIYYIPPQTIQTVGDFRVWLQSNNFDVVYEKATPTDFTFTGQEIPTRLGYNAFWSDEGDTEVTYRKDPDIPDPPVQVINMNDNENNDN